MIRAAIYAGKVALTIAFMAAIPFLFAFAELISKAAPQ